MCRIIISNATKFAKFSRGPSCPLVCVNLQVVVGDFDQFAIFARFAKFPGFPRGPSCLLICIGLQVVVGDFDQFAILVRFAKFAKITGFTRGPSCLLICIDLQVVVGEIDQFAIFARFAKFAGFVRGPSCLLICIGLQVVVGEILPFLPFLLLCAFLDISPISGLSSVRTASSSVPSMAFEIPQVLKDFQTISSGISAHAVLIQRRTRFLLGAFFLPAGVNSNGLDIIHAKYFRRTLSLKGLLRHLSKGCKTGVRPPGIIATSMFRWFRSPFTESVK